MRVRFETPDIVALRKEGYMLVDMHFHSRYSHDSSTPIQLIVERARHLGVFVALTDHNTIQGVLAAHQLAPGIVKPGIEITTAEGKDILAYFYEVADLERFFATFLERRIRSKSSLRSGKTDVGIAELLDELSRWRCVVAIAHPFAVGPRMSYKFFRSNGNATLVQRAHAIEVVNQALPHRRNLCAIGWAMQEGRGMTCGSDGHIISMLGSAFTMSKASTWVEFLDNVKAQRTSVIGEEKQLHHHVANMTRILREKARILENRRIKREQC